MPIDATILSVIAPDSAFEGSPITFTVKVANTGFIDGYCYVEIPLQWGGEEHWIETTKRVFPIGAILTFEIPFVMPNDTLWFMPMVSVAENLADPFWIAHMWTQMGIFLETGTVVASIDYKQWNTSRKAGETILVILRLKNIGEVSGYIRPSVEWTVAGEQEEDFGEYRGLTPGEADTWNFNRTMPPMSIYVTFKAHHWNEAANEWVLGGSSGPFLITLETTQEPPPEDDWPGLFEYLQQRVEKAMEGLTALEIAQIRAQAALPGVIKEQTDSWWGKTWGTVTSFVDMTVSGMVGDIDGVKEAQARLSEIWRDLDFSWPNVGAYMLDFLPGAKPIADIWDAINTLKGWMDAFDLDLGNLLANPIDWIWDRLWDWLNTEVEP